VRRNVPHGSDGNDFLIGGDGSWMAAKTATNCYGCEGHDRLYCGHGGNYHDGGEDNDVMGGARSDLLLRRRRDGRAACLRSAFSVYARP
jgi:hypothetical protein